MADTLTHISLCAGIGGLDLGIKRVFPSVRTIAYVEREISACEILGSQMEKGNLDLAPIWTDVKTFPADSFRGKVDIVSGGYPCQPFSVAGQRRGTEDPRHLWPYIARIVDVIRPKICVFENVRGHVRLGLSEVLGDLRGIGYRVRAGIFSAAEVGAPHRRERVFIMAYSDIIGSERREACARETGWPESTVSCEFMADSIQPGLQGHARDGAGRIRQEREVSQSHRSVGKDGLLDDAFETLWPSRPGEPQHEWEEPRTVDRKLNPSWVAQLMGLPHDWVEVPGLTREMKLRSLGNGVVPQQAELAIRTLYNDP